MKQSRLGALCGLLVSGCTFLFLGVDRCGDAVLSSADESCDDGNKDSGDGCDETCNLEPGFLCPTPGQPCLSGAICGNGVEEAGEECDDGNANNTDDCLDSCVLASCGDGFIQSGVETCEPPNVGGCDANCQVTCTIAADCLESPDNLCTENEDCDTNLGICVSSPVNIDDNNDCTADACDPSTGVSHDPEANGTVCDADNNAGTRDICINTNCGLSLCGDNFVDAGNGETCDDGNNINTDACPSGVGGTCKVAVCGDGFILAGTETCDDGNNTAGDGCDQSCQAEGTVVDCAANPNALENALSGASLGGLLLVVNGASCQFSNNITINQSLSIVGSGQTISIDKSILVGGLSTVSIQNAAITANNGNNLIQITGSAKLALIATNAKNLATNASSRVIKCDLNAKVLADRSTFSGSTNNIVIQLTDACQAIFANSLIIENIDSKDVISLESSAKVNIAFSTFQNNGSAEQGVIDIKNGATECRIDSVLGSNVGNDPVRRSAGAALINTIATFVQGEAEFGITNVDPVLNATHHATNAAVLGQGNPNPGTGTTALFFDPTTIVPGLNIFNHDFNNNPRPQGSPDPGAFEEP